MRPPHLKIWKVSKTYPARPGAAEGGGGLKEREDLAAKQKN